ncbi:MAG: hypothetical protein ACR2G5_09265 [Pyrinomonadaceae bacterium]
MSDMQEEGRCEVSIKQTEWCSVPVIIDDATSELFQMPAPDEDPDQQPAFHITQSTADLVPRDFERYQPSLQRMVENWREDKERVMQEKKAQAGEGRSMSSPGII